MKFGKKNCIAFSFSSFSFSHSLPPFFPWNHLLCRLLSKILLESSNAKILEKIQNDEKEIAKWKAHKPIKPFLLQKTFPTQEIAAKDRLVSGSLLSLLYDDS